VSTLGSKHPGSSRGTVSLVALCFVAVLGISLAGYIAVCSRAMTLSNRSYQGSLSRQLAEAGIEEALRAFNKNDWSDWSNGGFSADWTLDTTNRRATATLVFPADNFGQGTTATVKVRVDNYDAAHLGSTWSSLKSYRIGDQVGYNGVWYSCVQNHINQTPSDFATLAYWVPDPFPWKWRSNSSYYEEDVVNYDHDNDGVGTWFRCTSDHTSPTTWSGSNWTAISAIASYTSSYWSHTDGDVFYYPNSTTWYRWSGTSPSTSYTSSPKISWKFDSDKLYKFNDLVCYGPSYTWYRYINGTSASGIAPGTDASYWENALSGNNTTSTPGSHGWSSSSINYNLWDTVYYNGQWYRCIRAHTSGSITPTNTSYWSNSPLFSTAWDSGKQYSQNDTIRYNGIWYLSLQNNNVAQNPATATSYWIGTNTSNASYTWNSVTNYSPGAYRCYGGVWYKCLLSHTNKSPNDATFWTASWANSAGVTTGTPVVYAEASVSIANSPTLRTQLRAPIAPAPLFPNAAGATTNLTISTGGGTVDSYDSSVAGYSSGTAGSSAVLAAGSTLTIGGATAVKGYLAWPAPPSGISSGTTLNGISYGSDKSRISRSPSVPQFQILPSNGLTAAFSSASFAKGTPLANNPSGTVTIGTPGAATPARYYHNSDLQIGSSGSYEMATLKINGPVILYVNGNLRVESGGIIDIASTGSAEIHYKLIFRAYSGSAGIRNRSQDPKKLILLNDSTSSNLTFFDNGGSSTNRDFHGVVYAPNITTSAGLDIRDGINIYGALSAKNITFSSEANLHYDTSLRYATIPGVDQPYAVTEWRELPATEQATLP
jgi:hypothetical protein